MIRKYGTIVLVLLTMFTIASFGTPAAAYASSGTVSVTDFGAKGNGVANDAPAFVAAIQQAQKNGSSIISVPPGTYYGGQ